MFFAGLLFNGTAFAELPAGGQLDAPPTGAVTEDARELLAKKKWAEAAIVLKRIVRQSPDALSAQFDLGRALVYSGRREEALSGLIQQAGKEKGARREAIVRRVQVTSRLFLTNETFQAFQEALGQLEGKKYRIAQERFEKLLKQEPDNVEVLVRLGQSLLLQGDYDSAAERLRLARKLNPFDPQIHLWLGRVLFQRGELTEAIQELKSAAQGMKGSELAPLWYAEALASVGQRPAAIQFLEEDTRAYPFHLQGLVLLARFRRFQSPRDVQTLWTVRKDLQLALSRFEKYEALVTGSAKEGDLGVDLRSPARLKEEIHSLLQRVDADLQKTEST